MKIAYLITAYANYIHLDRLIKSLDQDEVVFFIHIDKKSPLPTNFSERKNIVFVDRVKVWWAGWSHQQAILNLVRSAYRQSFDYYVLISGADYPIKRNDYLYARLNEGGEYIDLIKGFVKHKPEWRVRYYHFDCFDRRKNGIKNSIFHNIERIIRLFCIKNRYPFRQIYHGSTWWALSHDCITYIINFIDCHPEYLSFYRTSWCPEESLFHTIIGNSNFACECKGNLTYADWSTDPAPAFLTEKHIDDFATGNIFEKRVYAPFFARKFCDDSENVISMIDSILRTPHA